MSECENNCCPGGRKTDKRGTAKKMSGGCRADGYSGVQGGARADPAAADQR